MAWSGKRLMGDFSDKRVNLRDKAQRMVLRIRNALLNDKTHSLPVLECGKLGKDLGFRKDAAFGFLERYARLFEIVDGLGSVKRVKMSDEAQQLVLEERRLLKEQHEAYVVYVLRKLLMLSVNERIPVAKLQQVNASFGFPGNLRSTILPKYPNYFHLDRKACHGTGRLQLVQWDPELAITVREKTIQKLQQSNMDEHPFMLGIPVENGSTVGRLSYEELVELQRLPLPSPYDHSQRSQLDRRRARNRHIAVCHEVLSLTLLKRLPIPHLADFREEFLLYETKDMKQFFTRKRKFLLYETKDMEKFFMRNRDFFAVEQLGKHQFVLLTEGYNWDHVPELTPYLQVTKRFLDLVKLPDAEDPYSVDDFFDEDQIKQKLTRDGLRGACEDGPSRGY